MNYRGFSEQKKNIIFQMFREKDKIYQIDGGRPIEVEGQLASSRVLSLSVPAHRKILDLFDF